MSLRFLGGGAATTSTATEVVEFYPTPYKATKQFLAYKNLIDFEYTQYTAIKASNNFIVNGMIGSASSSENSYKYFFNVMQLNYHGSYAEGNII